MNIPPVKMFFFGAGTSKSIGLLLASELLPAIYAPERFGIDIRLSELASVRNGFPLACDAARRFLDILRDGQDLHQDHLRKAFEVFEACEESGSGFRTLNHDQVVEAQHSLIFALGILLNFAYRSKHGPDYYTPFLQWTKRTAGWPVIVTTNWDYILDVLIGVYYTDDLIDCGDCDPPLKELLVRYILRGSQIGQAISLYKLNGSLDWLYCSKERSYYAPLFQPPWNLTAATGLMSVRLKLHPAGSPASRQPPTRQLLQLR